MLGMAEMSNMPKIGHDRDFSICINEDLLKDFCEAPYLGLLLSSDL